MCLGGVFHLTRTFETFFPLCLVKVTFFFSLLSSSSSTVYLECLYANLFVLLAGTKWLNVELTNLSIQFLAEQRYE